MRSFLKKYTKDRRGFTFVELLVVVTIIILLASAATSSYSVAQKRTRDQRRKTDMNAMKGALEEYYAANSSLYPDTCSTALTYLQGNWPTDPGTTSYTDGAAGSCTTTTFCICATMEVTGSGNASSTACAWGGSKNYFCVVNSQ